MNYEDCWEVRGGGGLSTQFLIQENVELVAYF